MYTNKIMIRNVNAFQGELMRWVRYNNFSRNSRSVFAWLRMGILPLRIETGRLTNLERIYECCQMNVVEDEHHFLLEYTLHVDLRWELTNARSQPNTEFNDLSKDKKIKFILGKVFWFCMVCNNSLLQKKVYKCIKQ